MEETDEPAASSPPKRKKNNSMSDSREVEKDASHSGSGPRSNIPYPTFSKAHSKEAVGSREALQPTLNVFTPDPTDLDPAKAVSERRETGLKGAPPSPPLTSVEPSEGTSTGVYTKQEKATSVKREDRPSKKKKSHSDKTVKVRLRPKSTNSHAHVGSGSDVSSPEKASRAVPSPLKNRQNGDAQRSTSLPSRAATPKKKKKSIGEIEEEGSVSSKATSVAPKQPACQRLSSRPQAVTIEDDRSSQETSILDKKVPRTQSSQDVFTKCTNSPTPDLATNHPPPPPPPPLGPITQPKVDYLIQHGGLHQPVSRRLLLAGKSDIPAQDTCTEDSQTVTNLFEPYSQLLDDYQKVISKHGSLAVATGSRSVARRLLDRLEAVFARDISAETCQCYLCTSTSSDACEDPQNFSWGEMLELVSGRRDLPSWPPFSLTMNPKGLGISLEAHVPMQKVDIDVPEEYKSHYIRQSKRTKERVDRWLLRQDDDSSNLPEEVDDETLSFAIWTHLGLNQRPAFNNLLGFANPALGEVPARIPTPHRGPTPQPTSSSTSRPRPAAIVLAGQAIQRLYRLASPPRDPETAIYLLKNPDLHNALATLVAISDDEWDILISGRFDGFLRSGAEDAAAPALPASHPITAQRSAHERGPNLGQENAHSRVASNPSCVPAPATGAHYGAPIAYDEETEVATLAEIERDIYSSMEALEDAFEALHVKAEQVRQALRERGAGLAAMQQRRKGITGEGVEVRMDTPADGVRAAGGNAGFTRDGRWLGDNDDGMTDWDLVSDLGPDDSASNISSSRRRRPKRRNERRTPAPVEEEEAEEEEDRYDEKHAERKATVSPRKR